MTALRIDTAKFKAACEDVRYWWNSQTEEDHARNARMGFTVLDFYRSRLDGDDFRVKAPVNLWVPAPTASDADELRSQLRVASQAAQQFGATASQIDFIVALAIKNNDFNVLSGGRLSKTEASRIIDQMKG